MSNKKMRRADKKLAESLDFCKWFVSKQKAKVNKIILSVIQKPRAISPKTDTYNSMTVVKMSKGDFRVEADGKVINKRFKSITQANEWCELHKKI